jgi:hypothetical protein
MNLRNSIFVLAIAAAIFATVFFQQEDTAPTITSSPPVIDKPVVQSSTAMVPKPTNAPAVDWDSIKDRMDKPYFDMTFTAEEEEAFNKLHVLPLNWITQVECLSDSSSCVYVYKYPPHTYASIDKTELAELSYADPAAALFMALRYGEEWTDETRPFKHFSDDGFDVAADGRIDSFLRSAALSGKTGPLMRLAAGVGSEGHRPGFRLGIPTPTKKTALLKIANLLGDPRADWRREVDEWREFAGSHLTDEEREKAVDDFLEGVDVYYQHYMNEMNITQQEVTGSNQISRFALNKDNINE